MTVGSSVKGCYFAIKSAQASFEQLALKTNVPEAKKAYEQAKHVLSEVESDLEKQVIFLANEEPQYK